MPIDMESGMECLPDEVLLKILGELVTEPDVLFNITPVVSKQFRHLSYDSSLWRTFCIPDHWHLDTVIRFLQNHPVASFIRTLTCGTGVVKKLAAVGAALTNVTRLSVWPASDRNCDGESDYTEDLIPRVFPNLQCFEVCMFEGVSSTMEHLERLRNSLSQLEVIYSGEIEDTRVLQFSGLKKEMLHLRGLESLEEVGKDTKQYDLPNTIITFSNKTFEDFSVQCEAFTLIGNVISKLHLNCKISLNDVANVAESCPKLTYLCLSSCEESASSAPLKDMTDLKDLTLFLHSMSGEDTGRIIKACPNLRRLSISAYADIIVPTDCSLPTTLRSLHLEDTYQYDSESTLAPCDDRTNPRPPIQQFFCSLLRTSQQCCRLSSLDMEPASMLDSITGMLDAKTWPCLKEVSLRRLTSHKQVEKLLLHLKNNQSEISELEVCILDTVLEPDYFRMFASFPSLRNLRFEGPFRNVFEATTITFLADKCSLLESIRIVDNLCQRDPTLGLVMPLLETLNSFQRLKTFTVSGHTSNGPRWMSSERTIDLEKELNSSFGPWRWFQVDETSITFFQCPPVFRIQRTCTVETKQNISSLSMS